MKGCLTIVAIIVTGLMNARAAAPTSIPSSQPSPPRVESVHFETKQRMPSLEIAPPLEPVRRLISQGVDRLPEGSLLVGAVTGGQNAFGLRPAQVSALNAGMKEVYGRIDADPAFGGVGTALGEAMSQDRTRAGHYSSTVPRRSIRPRRRSCSSTVSAGTFSSTPGC